MPLYSYRCRKGHEFDRVLRLSNWDAPQQCECGSDAERVIKATMVFVDGYEYRSPVDGRLVRGKKQRVEDLKRNNCVEYDPSYRVEYERKRAQGMAKLEKEVDEHVDREIALMSPRKRELLEQELRGGADVAVERTSVQI